MQRKIQYTIIAILCFLCLNAKAQCDYSFNGKYITSYWNCGLEIVKQPIDYNLCNWLTTAGVAGLSLASFYADKSVYILVNNNLSNNWKSYSESVQFLGDELFLVPLTACGYLISYIGDDCRLRQASLAGLQSVLFAEAGGLLLKELTCRERPNEFGNNSNVWAGPFDSFSSTSFPSGHAIRSFALASTLSALYSDRPWVGITAYGLATIASASRITASEHWCSDVVIGAALGYFIGQGVAKFNKQDRNDRLSLSSSADSRGIGFTYKL